jgi:hypothetical protein
MFKKTIFISFLTLSILFFPTVIHADQYYDQYPGNGFIPKFATSAYFRSFAGQLNHDDIYDEDYLCPVNFNVPDGSIYFIKSIGIRYKDNLTDGYLLVELRRRNLYTGAMHVVATWQSNYSGASSGEQTASKGTEPGVKLVDTKKFAYWLTVYFSKDGDTNPSTQMELHQIRVHYGT